MKDITIIIPIHKQLDSLEEMMLNCFNNISRCQENYKNGILKTILIGPKGIISNFKKIGNDILHDNIKFVENNKQTDFCSQINKAVEHVETDHFSILECDDAFNEKWFNMAREYYYGNENVSLFLPINIMHDINDEYNFHFINEIAWAGSFTNTIGYLDFDCLQDYTVFNVTGGIFNTNDFKTIKGFKPSMKVSFNYELLLRMTKKEMKVFVVPKEGYKHIIGRKDSLTNDYLKEMSEDDIKNWFDIAKIECPYVDERPITIKNVKNEKLK